jgi:hypothetical protein
MSAVAIQKLDLNWGYLGQEKVPGGAV